MGFRVLQLGSCADVAIRSRREGRPRDGKQMRMCVQGGKQQVVWDIQTAEIKMTVVFIAHEMFSSVAWLRIGESIAQQ